MPQQDLQSIFSQNLNANSPFTQGQDNASIQQARRQLAYQYSMQKGISPTEAMKRADIDIAYLYGIDPASLDVGTGKLSAQQGAQKSKMQTGLSVLNQLGTMSNQINTQDFGPLARLQGLARGFAGSIGLDPQASAYESVMPAAARNIVKALGDTGALSDYDVTSVAKMLPQLGDSKEEANIKMSFIKSVINAGIQNLNSSKGTVNEGYASPTDAQIY